MNAAVSLALDKLEKSVVLYVNEAFSPERNLSPERDDSLDTTGPERGIDSPTRKQVGLGTPEPPTSLSSEQDDSPRRGSSKREIESPTGRQDDPGIHKPTASSILPPAEEAGVNSYAGNYGNDKGTPPLESAPVSESSPYTSKVQPLYLRIAATLIGVIMWAVILVLIAFCFPSVFGSYTEDFSSYAQQLARFLTTHAP